jgi:hypothetical protein
MTAVEIWERKLWGGEMLGPTIYIPSRLTKLLATLGLDLSEVRKADESVIIVAQPSTFRWSPAAAEACAC